MKNNKFLFAAILFIVSFSMIWMSCEKTDELTPTFTSEELTIPDEATAYLTTAEIDEIYSNVREETDLNPGWVLQPITIKMKTDVTYDKNNRNLPEPPEFMLFTGNGLWEEMKEYVKYYEQVSLIVPKGEDWAGKGTITLQKGVIDRTIPILPVNDQLTFLSGIRAEIGAAPFVEPVNTVIRSKIAFTAGTGIFTAAYGEAYKIETYALGERYHCDTFIYGFVKMRDRNPVTEPPIVEDM